MSRHYSDEFKETIVLMLNNCKKKSEIIRTYKIDRSTLTDWVKQYKKNGKFGSKESMTDSEKRMDALIRENIELRMENDLLEQLALMIAKRKR